MLPNLGPSKSPDNRLNMLCRVMETSPMGMLKKAPIAVSDVNNDTNIISFVDSFMNFTSFIIIGIILTPL